MCACRVGEVVCACSRVGVECGRAVVGEGAFQICGVWLSLYVGLGRDALVLW